jgi:hypothetical protein
MVLVPTGYLFCYKILFIFQLATKLFVQQTILGGLLVRRHENC